LRDKINYSPWFYYWAIVTDFILRFWWVAGLFAITYGHKDELFYDLKALTGFYILAEAFRRGFWALIRVENEQNNNFEGYRGLDAIPPVVITHVTDDPDH